MGRDLTPCPNCGALGWVFPCSECGYDPGHENHEKFDTDCPLCKAEIDRAAEFYRTRLPAYSKDEMDEARQIRPEMRR